MKKYLLFTLLLGCTTSTTATPPWSHAAVNNESHEPPQAKETYQSDAGSDNSNLYLTNPIDMDAAVNCERYPDTQICVTDASAPNTYVPQADSNFPATTASGYQACAKYHFYMFSVVHPEQGYTLPEGACDYGWAPFSDVLADECTKAAGDHVNDDNWIDYVRGTCQPSYVAGTL